MFGTFVVLWLVARFLNAGLLEPLDREAVSNADSCNDLNTEENCNKAGPCVWGGSPTPKCSKDPCFERTLTTTSDCPKTGTCVRVPKAVDPPVNPPVPSHFCVSSSRLSSFTTEAQICSLEWGEYKFVELGACKTLSTDSYGCGPVDLVQGVNTSHYVCKVGPVEEDPCTKITDPDVCSYVGDCMYEAGGCVTDPCWEKTYVSSDDCKKDCKKYKLNDGGSPEIGYCKTPNHDLHSPCNVGTATNVATKLAVCKWTATKIPDDCSKVATISNYDGDTLYVCNPTEEDFTVSASISLKPLVVALATLVFLITMM